MKQKFPYLTDAGHRLMNQMLFYNPDKRISALDALEHPYFIGNIPNYRAHEQIYILERPLPVKPEMMPTFPEYRNKRRQTDRKEDRKEDKQDLTRNSKKNGPNAGPISVTLTDS